MRLFGGMLIVAGTAIGAGMLALPVETALAGFGPSMITLVLVWAFMTYTAFLILEVTLAQPRGTNLVSMASTTLGPIGEAVAWVTYLLLLYSLTAVFISGSGALFINTVAQGVGIDWVGPLIFVIACAIVTTMGVKSVDRVNRVLMLGLVIVFVLLAITVGPQLSGTNLSYAAAEMIPITIPIAVVSFGFAIVIPTLVTYLDGNVRKLKLCLAVGSSIPLIVYVIWQLVIMGAIPSSDLSAMMAEGQPSVSLPQALKALTSTPFIPILARCFSFFAILTSLLGVTMSLWDFLADGLRLHHRQRGRILLTILTFVPPLLYAWFFPRGFIVTLGYASIFVSLLLGLLPICMAWSDRYIHKTAVPFRTPGGRPILVLAALFFLAAIAFKFI